MGLNPCLSDPACPRDRAPAAGWSPGQDWGSVLVCDLKYPVDESSDLIRRRCHAGLVELICEKLSGCGVVRTDQVRGNTAGKCLKHRIETDLRLALADAYLEVALGHSPAGYAVELDPDEGSGVLLSDLLQSAAADLDRISSSLDAVRDELGRDTPETSR